MGPVVCLCPLLLFISVRAVLVEILSYGGLGPGEKRAKTRDESFPWGRSPQPGRLQGSGELGGDLGRCRGAIGGIGFLFWSNDVP